MRVELSVIFNLFFVMFLTTYIIMFFMVLTRSSDFISVLVYIFILEFILSVGIYDLYKSLIRLKMKIERTKDAERGR